MSEVLSQNQIDDLFKSLLTSSTSEDNEDIPIIIEPKLKVYDFRSPKKFTREELRIVMSIYETYSRILSSYLSGIMRVMVDVEVVQIEEQRYYEFNNALDDSVLIGSINVAYPEEPSIEENVVLMNVDKEISFSIIDRILGGSGKGYKLDRPYTEIEKVIFENLFRNMAPLMSEAWVNYFPIAASFSKLETNSRLIQSISADEIVVLIVMNVTIEDVSRNFILCFPAVALEQILNAVEKRNLKKSQLAIDPEKQEDIFESVKDGNLMVKSILGTANVMVGDVFGLQVGDVIQLDQDIHSPVVMTVGDKPWFLGEYGTHQSKKAVRITQLMAKRGML